MLKFCNVISFLSSLLLLPYSIVLSFSRSLIIAFFSSKRPQKRPHLTDENAIGSSGVHNRYIL